VTGRSGLLRLAVGVVLRFDGLDWTVEEIQGDRSRLVLRPEGGQREYRTIAWVMRHPECRIVHTPAQDTRVGQVGQPPTWGDLTGDQQNRVRLRIAHVLEADTGFRSGDPRRSAPGEPRPAYDPSRTTVGQRRQAKVAELEAMGADEAAMLGLGQISERTLRRLASAWRTQGMAGCIDGRWLRAGGGHPSVSEPFPKRSSPSVPRACIDHE